MGEVLLTFLLVCLIATPILYVRDFVLPRLIDKLRHRRQQRR